MAAAAVVFGPVGRDLLLCVDDVPDAGESAGVWQRREVLGGKGANQAVAFARLGVEVALVGVVGDDSAGADALAQAEADGIDVSCVVRRAGASTGLIVEVLDGENRWRYLQDTPASVQLDGADVLGARDVVERAASVVVQLQQPAESALTAARLAREVGCRVVLDGAPEAEHRRDLLELAHVLRADGHEAELLTGTSIRGETDALHAAGNLLGQGPRLVALAVEGVGNLFAWSEGHVFYPLDGAEARDTTGAGDALVAALVTALDEGLDAAEAGRWAVAAASLAVEHEGGRPRLTYESVRTRADRQRGRPVG
ncbi:ribokinase [Actinospica robiniae]|uniref:ribokinase n=1 Tax=Actinospica robiniae TaxID=304901 RepID=UPI000418AB1A|nr:ribokinase [Actinospica robiniae]